MPFVLLARVLGVAILLLFNRAHGHDVGNDIQCPAGSHASFVHNSYTYNAPLHEFTNITKSWFNIQWYAGTVISNTTGTDGVPGATRSGVFGGAPFNETLTMYDRPHLGTFAYSFHGDALTYSPPNKSAVHFDGYAETMRLEGICNGRATYIDIISYLCSNDSIAAYDIWYALHMYSFQGMAASLGATVMAGDCPSETYFAKK
ncbi:hypothetical protein B0H14DRAFT_3873374 [Mycena olivaceomarginata]|nr:hypothetical protein B0H14DRAFT_3873374 [Mycena olivaceomarginata]